jgi:hypothetical protein
MQHALFLDTMVYLHYRSIEQVDWHDILGVPSTEEVVIVVPGITLREIDKHKNHTPRLRDRARRVSELLARQLPAGSVELRPGVRIEGALRSPSVDFAGLGLDPASNDDVLVASALDYQRTHPEVRVAVATQDSYPHLRAQGLGLVVRSLPDDLRLPAEEDPVERENRELKRQLQQLQAARPMLDLQFADGGGKSLTVVLSNLDSLSAAEIAATVREMEQRLPPADAFRSAAPQVKSASRPQQPGPDEGIIRRLKRATEEPDAEATQELLRDIKRAFREPKDERDLARYATERTAFLESYAAYLQERREYERARGRRFVLDLDLVNTGSTPAKDIDVHLYVPDGVTVSDEEDDLTEPEEPEPPGRPLTAAESMYAGLRSSLTAFDIVRGPDLSYLSPLDRAQTAGPRNVSPLEIEETESYDIRCHVDRVKHGLPVALPTIYVTIPEGAPARPFQVTYTLHAANLPAPVTGELNVILTSA